MQWVQNYGAASKVLGTDIAWTTQMKEPESISVYYCCDFTIMKVFSEFRSFGNNIVLANSWSKICRSRFRDSGSSWGRVGNSGLWY